MDKKVSIIIPVYNGSNYLREAIDSALAQTYKNIEIIVVNDGSKDDGATEQIALSYGDKIRYFKKENGGVATALNMGIQNMEGEYFSWLSHDDVYYPNKIEKEIEAIKASGDETTLVQCEYDFYDMGTGAKTPTNFHKYYGINQLTNSVFSVLQLQLHACAALVHKSHFERVGMFNEELRYAQDIEMWFRLFRGQRSLWVEKELYKVRIHKDADSQTFTEAVNVENAELYYNLINMLTDDELIEMYGTVASAVCRISGLIQSRGGYDKAKLLEKRVSKHIIKDKQMLFSDYLKNLSDGKTKKIILFGAGQYGARLRYELACRHVKIDGYMDNNPNKRGQYIAGVRCLLVEDYEEIKDEVLVIVTQRSCFDAVAQMKELKFPYVITRQELDAELLKYIPTQFVDYE